MKPIVIPQPASQEILRLAAQRECTVEEVLTQTFLQFMRRDVYDSGRNQGYHREGGCQTP